jgi:hypothetical protein
MSDSVVDDAVGFITSILGLLGVFILIGVIFINITGMVTMVVIQGIFQFITPWKINYWFMWGLSIAITHLWWYTILWLVKNKYPNKKKEICVPQHYMDEEKARYWFCGISGVLGTLYLVDCFYWKTGIGSYCTKCFFGFFY